jgi:hypothetical protein
MHNLFSDLTNLDDLTTEEREELIKLLVASERLAKKRGEYENYTADGDNLSKQE